MNSTHNSNQKVYFGRTSWYGILQYGFSLTGFFIIHGRFWEKILDGCD